MRSFDDACQLYEVDVHVLKLGRNLSEDGVLRVLLVVVVEHAGVRLETSLQQGRGLYVIKQSRGVTQAQRGLPLALSLADEPREVL